MPNDAVRFEPNTPHFHEPAILHRTGGRSASQQNVCGICGHMIILDPGYPFLTTVKWIIDKDREASMPPEEFNAR